MQSAQEGRGILRIERGIFVEIELAVEPGDGLKVIRHQRFRLHPRQSGPGQQPGITDLVAMA